jgi:predicted DNA-binding protein (UPF0251 family)
MSEISDLKKQILEARKQGDIDTELELLDELQALRLKDRRVLTVEEAYGELADSP